MTSSSARPATTPLELTQRLIAAAIQQQASDLHLAEGSAPRWRIDDALVAVGVAPLATDCLAGFCREVMTATQLEQLETRGAVDTAYSFDSSRLRINAYRQRGCLALAIRLVPPLAVATSDLPTWMNHAAELERGIVLVTGATGSGKSTTLARLIDRINRSRAVHIITIEDPIEHVHESQRALVTQREVPSDAPSFAEATRGVLRQDPDVVLIGEIRDRATMEVALTIAETGHLVLSSLHTGSASEAIGRVVDMFPPQDQGPVRSQLASTLELVVAQQLLPRVDGTGRVAAMEVLHVTAAVRHLIREGKLHQIENAMMLGRVQSGSRSMQEAIEELRVAGIVSPRGFSGGASRRSGDSDSTIPGRMQSR